MSQVITARLSRNDAQPWGFRLQGGKDFGTPLVIQKVSETFELIQIELSLLSYLSTNSCFEMKFWWTVLQFNLQSFHKILLSNLIDEFDYCCVIR